MYIYNYIFIYIIIYIYVCVYTYIRPAPSPPALPGIRVRMDRLDGHCYELRWT